MERLKIIIILNYVVGKKKFSLVMSIDIEQPKFQLEFKRTIILHPKNGKRKLNK
jgi:hypothetical protein